MPERQPPPFADRVDASLAFTGHLMSLLVGVPADLAQRVTTAWFDAVRGHCDRGLVVVFDHFVVGRPDPLLLEVAHQARSLRAAEDEAADEGDWATAAADEGDRFDHPRLFARVIDTLGGGQYASRIVGWPAIDAVLVRAFDRERDPISDIVDVLLSLERLVTITSRAIRIGDAAAISIRPSGRARFWRAAA